MYIYGVSAAFKLAQVCLFAYFPHFKLINTAFRYIYPTEFGYGFPEEKAVIQSEASSDGFIQEKNLQKMINVPYLIIIAVLS